MILTNCNSPKAEIEAEQTKLIKGELGIHLDTTLTPYVEELIKRADNQAGFAIGITKGTEIIYARTIGYADIDKKVKADFNTIFHISSVSKPFTAAAIMKLVQEKKLKLSDKIIDYIPEFEMKDAAYKQITIQHILTHTSGIPRHVSVDDWSNPIYGPNALEENLINVKEFELDFLPGTEYNYSNSAFDILGIVISRASGMTFEKYVEEHILKAGGMLNSTYDKPTESNGKLALPYSYGIATEIWSPYPHTGKTTPSSGVQTTLLDMCTWGMLHVYNGKCKEYQMLEGKYFEEFLRPRYETPWGDKIALSWYLQSYLEHPNIMHLGNETGFESNMYIYPDDSISIVVMANRDFSGVGRISLAAAEIIFGEKPKEYQVSARYKFGEAMRNEGIVAAKKLWEELRNDTTDIYHVDDEYILTAGAILENGGDWLLTKEILDFYLELDNQSTYAWRLFGNTQLNLGDTTAAIVAYNRALEIDPDYEKATKAIEELIGQ